MEKLLATAGVIIFGSSQNIILPILIDSFGKNFGGPYFILLWSSVHFVIIFGIIYGIILRRGYDPKLDKHKMVLFCLTGLFDALTGVFIVYSSDAKRTPVIMQSILAGSTIFPSIICTKFLIKKKGDISFNNKYVYISLIFLAIGVGIACIPEFEKSHWKPTNILWILFYTCGIICRSLYNVLQEKYIEIDGDTIRNKFNVLFWTCIFQLGFVVLFFWVDMVPYVGMSTDGNFISHLRSSFQCYFGKCNYTFMLETLFVFGYTMSYVSAIYLNADSANYNMIAVTLITPTVAIFFTIIPSLNSGLHYPIYITIPSILCCTTSLFIWGYWENKYFKHYYPLPQYSVQK